MYFFKTCKFYKTNYTYINDKHNPQELIMSDFKSKLPDLKEVTGMISKFAGDVKNSIMGIVADYKKNHLSNHHHNHHHAEKKAEHKAEEDNKE